MTEFEAAHAFVTEYAEAVAVAIDEGEDALDDRAEFQRWCSVAGICPTPERLALALDIVSVASEYFACGESYYDGPEAEGRRFDPEDLVAVPVLYLADGLECHGWRRGFLGHDAHS